MFLGWRDMRCQHHPSVRSIFLQPAAGGCAGLDRSGLAQCSNGPNTTPKSVCSGPQKGAPFAGDVVWHFSFSYEARG